MLPFANVKIFLTASSEERAKRRFSELCAKGEGVTYEQVLADMISRDTNDSTRKCAPLKAAEDAVYVDTSDFTFDEAVEHVKAIIADKVGDKK